MLSITHTIAVGRRHRHAVAASFRPLTARPRAATRQRWVRDRMVDARSALQDERHDRTTGTRTPPHGDEDT
jgi:hypothetical protein